MCSPRLTGHPLALVPAPPAPPPASPSPAQGRGREGGAGGRRRNDWTGPGGSAAHLLCSRSAAAPARPGTGWGVTVRGAAGRSPRRRPGTGAEEPQEVQGPHPRPLCPCAPPPGSAVGRGGRWPVAEAAPGPWEPRRASTPTHPSPAPRGDGSKNGSVAREGRMTARCGLPPHIRFTYAERERGGEGRASLCPRAPSRPEAERTAPKVFKRSSVKRQPRRKMDGESCPLIPAPGGAAPSISAGAASYVPLFSRSILACFEIKKTLVPRHHSPLTSTHTPPHTQPQAPPSRMNHSALLGAKLSWSCSVSPDPTASARPLHWQPNPRGASLSHSLSQCPQCVYLF